MTVKELIERLEKFNPDAIVRIECYDDKDNLRILPIYCVKNPIAGIAQDVYNKNMVYIEG